MSANVVTPADIESQVARWVAGFSIVQAPEEVRQVATACMVDGLGVALAGSRSSMYGQCSGLSRPEGNCSLIGFNLSTDVQTASFLNSVACHVLDFDDTSYAGIVHGTAVVFPAVLAAAQQTDASGECLLEAFVCGVETEYALGLALTDSLYERGHWATATLGVIGAAAGVAKLLRLETDRIADAIRLAANMPLGLRATHGTNGKPYLCGLAARLGVEAAYAARAGINGRPGTFELPYGFANTLNGGELRKTAIAELGKTFSLIFPGIAYKLHPLCSATQAAIDAALALRARHGFSPSDVVSVICHSTPLAVACLPYREATTQSQAQFSMPFAIACALVNGDVGIRHLDPATLQSLELQDLMSHIELVADATLVPAPDAATFPEASRVEITLRDGRTVTETVLAATGMPQRPATARQLLDKFMDCASVALESADARTLLGRFQHVAEMPSTRRLLELTPQARCA